jgi:hypothetical protein
LAGEHGAAAVYRVRRGANQVRVEGWSAGGSCLMSRNLPKSPWSRTSRLAHPLFAISA